MPRPIGIDLFSGAGGMSLGFEQAGFDVMAAVDVDPIHCAVHKFNFPNCAVIPKSVALMTGKEIRAAAGLTADQKIDCVFGGPPCQGFSLIGHRVLDDPRNSLVLEFVRLVQELDAQTFVFENVKGLTVGRHRVFLEELVVAFSKAGYVVRLPWQVFDAANFGVPQHRQRLIIVGAKQGVPLPLYPTKTTCAADKPELGLTIGPTCADALSDLPDADKFSELQDKDSVQPKSWKKPSSYGQEMRCLSNDAWHFGYVRNWNPALLTSSWRTEHTQISRERFTRTEPGNIEPISRFFRLPSDGLSNTLRAGTDGARGAFTSPRPIHYRYARCITVREMARLHGFPDWFRLHWTKWHGARQIGNAVPPALARAVAVEIVKALNFKISRPKKSIDLGEEALLYMDMSGASKYFQVESLNGRRDRKSGARKRSQLETEAARIKALVEAHV